MVATGLSSVVPGLTSDVQLHIGGPIATGSSC